MRSRSAAALLLAAVLVAAPVAPAAACACGGVAPPGDADVAVGQEHALVSWQDGVEQIDLLLGLLSDEATTGLVFPTPSPATVSLGDREDFAAVGRVTTPRRVEVYDWWSVPGDGGTSAGAPPEILDEVRLGPIEAVTLAASDAAGLEDWLAGNGFELAPEVAALLGSYVERGWYFVAVRLTGDSPLDGDIDPVRFRFESETLVYPLELSQAATTPQTVRLYVFDDHRQRVSFTGGQGVAPAYESWAAPVDGTEVARFGDYLTVFEIYFADPATQVLGDLEFSDALTDAPTGTEHRVVVPVAIGGLPVGWILVALVALALVGVVVAVRVRRV